MLAPLRDVPCAAHCASDMHYFIKHLKYYYYYVYISKFISFNTLKSLPNSALKWYHFRSLLAYSCVYVEGVGSKIRKNGQHLNSYCFDPETIWMVTALIQKQLVFSCRTLWQIVALQQILDASLFDKNNTTFLTIIIKNWR